MYVRGQLELAGNNLQEQKTQAHASGGSVTFSTAISTIEIYNTAGIDGTFTVNGIAILVPAGISFKSSVGGTASPTVTVTGATSYILSRYT